MVGCTPLSDNDLALVTAAFRGTFQCRNRALFVLGYTSGFRISELLSLLVRDISVNGVLVSHVRVRRSNMKGRRRSRSVSLAPLARPYLEAWLSDLALSGRTWLTRPLFVSRIGSDRPISRVQAYRVLKTAFNRAGLFGPDGTYGTHCMRKTFADRMFEHLDGNIFSVQSALGHASPASTVSYLSFNEAEQKAAIDAAYPNPKEIPPCQNASDPTSIPSTPTPSTSADKPWPSFSPAPK